MEKSTQLDLSQLRMENCSYGKNDKGECQFCSIHELTYLGKVIWKKESKM